MDQWIKFFAEQKILPTLATVFVIGVGLFAGKVIPREVFPNISFDTVLVTVPYPGASADAVESLVTNPLEQELQEVDGIKRMLSVSTESNAAITLVLDPDQTTIEEAEADIQDVVDAFSDLPEDALDPVVTALDSQLNPIVEIALSEPKDELKRRKIAKEIEKELEKIRDVARVDLDDFRDREIIVEAQPDKLRQYQVSLSDLIQTLKAQNIDVPGGTLKATADRPKELTIRTRGQFQGKSDVENAVIRANALAVPIKVKDVANVREALEEVKSYSLINGKPSIRLTVLKKSNGDAIRLVEKVTAKLDKINEKYSGALSYELIDDRSYLVKRRLKVLSGNLIIGLSLVLIILSIFLPFKVAMIAAFGIPFSFLGTIAIFYWGGISLNLISMMGLIIVVGMLVDDAIVVVENAQRYMEQGLSPIDAAIKGTREIWAPVTTSVFTTIIAFAPFLFASGIFGKFVAFIPLGVIIALAISLIECFFILPNHIGHWLSAKTKSTGASAKGLWTAYMLPTYRKYLNVSIRWRYLTVIPLITAFVSAILLVKAGKVGFVLFPKGAVDSFIIEIETPVGTPLAKTEEILAPIMDEVSQLPDTELENYRTRIGTRTAGQGLRGRSGSHIAQIKVFLTPTAERERSADQIISFLRDKVGEVPGTTKLNYRQQRGGPPVGRPVAIDIRGESYDRLLEAAGKVALMLEDVEGVSDIENDYVEGKKEISIIVDRPEAAAAGLSISAIGTTVRAAYEGVVATSIRTLDEEVEVRVQLPETQRQDDRTLENLMVLNSQGKQVPLRRVANFEENKSIAAFEHEDNQRQIEVFAELDTKINTPQVVAGIMKKRIKEELEGDYTDLSFHFGGEAQDTKESIQSLVRSGALALVGILLLLILLFQNLYQPFVVALAIPLGATGVIWAFYMQNIPLSFLGTIGLIALAGVIINNAIVFVDFVNVRKRDGYDSFSAITDAACARIRPILLTTCTTVAGILPTAYGIGGLDPFVVPIAMALGWGMLIGSTLALAGFPSVLMISEDIVSLLSRIWHGIRGLVSSSKD